MHQYSKFFANVRQSIQDDTFEQHSALFVETFGTEPERTGEIHAARAAVEAALLRRNRLDGDSDDDAEALKARTAAAEEKRMHQEKQREARRARNREEGLKNRVNKKEMRSEMTLQQELPTQQQQEGQEGEKP